MSVPGVQSGGDGSDEINRASFRQLFARTRYLDAVDTSNDTEDLRLVRFYADSQLAPHQLIPRNRDTARKSPITYGLTMF